MVNYLNGLKKDIGLLINFGPTGLEVKHKYRARKVEDENSPLEVDFTSSLSSPPASPKGEADGGQVESDERKNKSCQSSKSCLPR